MARGMPRAHDLATAAAVGEPRPFCVQKHAARRLHYDFRLELDGVLVSWAVPKGPSLDAAEKRFAVEVEDHPVEYADFEGVIPEGNYGAGAVIVWDRGVWIPTTDPVAGLRDGKLDFELRGYKLRGLWHMVRTKRAAAKDPPEWLLMKKADGWARPPEVALDEGSIYSGLTLEEIEGGPRRAAETARFLEEAGARKRAVPVDDVKLMLAETRDDPFTDDAWVFELKHDGFRLLAARDGRAAAARLPPRRRLDARLPRGRARGAGACPTRTWCWTARWWCSTSAAVRASRACRSASSSRAGPTSTAPPSSGRRRCSCSTCWRSRATTCARCRSSRASRRCGC